MLQFRHENNSCIGCGPCGLRGAVRRGARGEGGDDERPHDVVGSRGDARERVARVSAPAARARRLDVPQRHVGLRDHVGGLGELYLAVSGYPVNSLSQNEADTYRFLRNELKLNKAAAAGVLANIYCESIFSSVAIGDGGTSLGLCQWHAERCRSLINWCGGQDYDYRSVEGQLHYLSAELRGGYSGVLDQLLSVPDTAEGAYQAGYYFCMHFEMPDNTATRSDARGQIAARTYFPADLDRYLAKSEAKKSRSGERMLKMSASLAGTIVTTVGEPDFIVDEEGFSAKK